MRKLEFLLVSLFRLAGRCRFDAVLVLVSVGDLLVALPQPVIAGLIVTSAYANASDYAFFRTSDPIYLFVGPPPPNALANQPHQDTATNSTLNSPARVDNVSGGTNSAWVNSAFGVNSTDYSTNVYAQGGGSTYRNPSPESPYPGNNVYTSVSTNNQIYFTLIETSTATLYFFAEASTNDLGVLGDSHAQAFAQFYDYNAGISYFYSAASDNGGYYESSSYIPLTLQPGNYSLITGTTAFGTSYAPSGGDIDNANATALLYNIEGVAPEPSTLLLLGIGLVGLGAYAWGRRNPV